MTEVVGNEEEGMFTCLPVHTAIPTLTLRHHDAQVGVAFTQLRQVVAAFPLRADTLDVLLQRLVIKRLLHIIQTVGVDGSQPEFNFRMMLPECRCQIFIVEAKSTIHRPWATGIRGVGVSLVLVHHLRDWQALLLVEVDETAEHLSITLQIARFLNEIALCCQSSREDTVAVAQQFHLIGINDLVVGIQQVILPGILLVVLAREHTIILIDLHP